LLQVKQLAAGRRERVAQIVGQYGEVLTFLKEKGGLLNTVAPESLLPKDDFVFFKVRRRGLTQGLNHHWGWHMI
jgi:hypothetical protein